MKKLKINDVCPYCGRVSVVFDYEGKHDDLVFAVCLCCQYESDRFSVYDYGSVLAHCLASNYLPLDYCDKLEVEE